MMTSHSCLRCEAREYNPNFVPELTAKLDPPIDFWPPDFDHEHTLRAAYKALHNLGTCPIHAKGMEETCQDYGVVEFNTALLYKNNAEALSGWVYGLCLPCPEGDVHPLKCPDLSMLMERANRMDPLMTDMANQKDGPREGEDGGCVVS